MIVRRDLKISCKTFDIRNDLVGNGRIDSITDASGNASGQVELWYIRYLLRIAWIFVVFLWMLVYS